MYRLTQLSGFGKKAPTAAKPLIVAGEWLVFKPNWTRAKGRFSAAATPRSQVM